MEEINLDITRPLNLDTIKKMKLHAGEEMVTIRIFHDLKDGVCILKEITCNDLKYRTDEEIFKELIDFRLCNHVIKSLNKSIKPSKDIKIPKLKK